MSETDTAAPTGPSAHPFLPVLLPPIKPFVAGIRKCEFRNSARKPGRYRPPPLLAVKFAQIGAKVLFGRIGHTVIGHWSISFLAGSGARSACEFGGRLWPAS